MRCPLRGPLTHPRARRTAAYAALAAAGLVMALAAPAAESPQLDSITVQARKDREKLEQEVSQFVGAAMVHRWGEGLLRWQTPVCPLVAGMPRETGEFILRRVSQAARNAGAPLAPEQCKANFLILVTAEPDQLLAGLLRKQPRIFDLAHGLGAVHHFLQTERPVRVWYNVQDQGDDAGMGTAVAVTGTSSPSAKAADWPSARLPNSRLTYTVSKSIYTAIIAVDLHRMNNVNIGQLADYAAMVGLAEINMDRTVDVAPSILQLFGATGDAPSEGMSVWDQALLKSLYGSRANDAAQMSAMETRIADDITRH